MGTLTRSDTWRLLLATAFICAVLFASKLFTEWGVPKTLPPPPDELQRTLVWLAGPKAIDCGHIYVGGCTFDPNAFKVSDSCVATAFRNKRAFKVRYDSASWNPQSKSVSSAITRTPQGETYSLMFSPHDLPFPLSGKPSKHLYAHKFKHPWVRTFYGRQRIVEHGSWKALKLAN